MVGLLHLSDVSIPSNVESIEWETSKISPFNTMIGKISVWFFLGILDNQLQKVFVVTPNVTNCVDSKKLGLDYVVVLIFISSLQVMCLCHRKFHYIDDMFIQFSTKVLAFKSP